MKKLFFFYNFIFLRDIIFKKTVFSLLPHKFLVRKNLDFAKKLYIIDTSTKIFNFKIPRKSKRLLLKKKKHYSLTKRQGTFLYLKFLFPRKNKNKRIKKKRTIKNKKFKKNYLKLQVGDALSLDSVFNSNIFNPTFSFYYFKKKKKFQNFQYLYTIISRINISTKYIKLKKFKNLKKVKKLKKFFLIKGVTIKYIRGLFFFFKQKYIFNYLKEFTQKFFYHFLGSSCNKYKKQQSIKTTKLYSVLLKFGGLKQFSRDTKLLIKRQERLTTCPIFFLKNKIKKKKNNKRRNKRRNKSRNN